MAYRQRFSRSSPPESGSGYGLDGLRRPGEWNEAILVILESRASHATRVVQSISADVELQKRIKKAQIKCYTRPCQCLFTLPSSLLIDLDTQSTAANGTRRRTSPTTSPSSLTSTRSAEEPTKSPELSKGKVCKYEREREMECVVHGIIETEHVEALKVLLQGLCGVPEERLRVHELCLKSGTNLGVVSSEVRLLCDLAQPTPSWTVRHVGGAMRGAGADQISVLVRTVVESKVSNNALRFFYALGYTLDHELLKVGFTVRFQRGAQITVNVSSANKMPKLHAVDEAVPVTPGIQMVEIRAPAAADNYNEVASAVTSFCEYLAPLLHLSKPGVSTGIVATAAAAAASLMSNTGGKAL